MRNALINNSERKTDLKIDWIEKERFNNLPLAEKNAVLEIDRLNTYINKLEKSIKKGKKLIDKEIKKRKERTKKRDDYKRKAKVLFQSLLKYKSKIEFDLYFRDYVEKKKVNKPNQQRHLEKVKIKKGYRRILLEYQIKNTDHKHSIHLGKNADELLNELKVLAPKWYNAYGDKVYVESAKRWDVEIMKDFFRPIIKTLLKRRTKKYSNEPISEFKELRKVIKRKYRD